MNSASYLKIQNHTEQLLVILIHCIDRPSVVTLRGVCVCVCADLYNIIIIINIILRRVQLNLV